LHQFWQADFKPDMKLFKKFRGYLLVRTQINGVYYGDRCFEHDIKVDKDSWSLTRQV
jgi:capsular polysaccharide export protein